MTLPRDRSRISPPRGGSVVVVGALVAAALGYLAGGWLAARIVARLRVEQVIAEARADAR